MARFAPPLHWSVIAAMSLALAVAVAIGLGARGLDRLATAREQALSEERIARLIAPLTPAAAEEARAALAGDADVAEARLIPPQEAADLVSGWAQGQDLPADAFADLRLIAIRMERNAPEAAPSRLQADLAEQGLSIEIAAPGPTARRAARRTGADRYALFALAAGALAAAMVGLLARSVVAHHGAAAAMLMGLGATRAQAETLMSGRMAAAGMQAGLWGAALALAVIGACIGLVPALGAMAPGPDAPLVVADCVPLVAAPMIGWAAAASGARAAAGRAFDRADFAK
jgi:hypothetical protein